MSKDLIYAISVISRYSKSGNPFPAKFDQLDVTTRSIALSMFDSPKNIKLELCPRCNSYKELTGWLEHYFGTDACCEECSDGNNQRLMDFRKDWDKAFEKYHGVVRGMNSI